MPAHPPRRAWRAIPFILLIVSLACSLPSITRRDTPAPTATEAVPQVTEEPPPLEPTPTPQPLPPQVVESDPAPGEQLALTGPITLYFSQPMDRASVEAAFSAPEGELDWRDDATLSFVPEAPFEPDAQVSLNLESSARGANGLSLTQPVSLTYQTVGLLALAQRLPEPGATEVNPASAVAATFNRPVVPLGADPETLTPAFTLSPPAVGRGEWLNTSTYIFYPDPALSGGTDYTARLNPQLTGVSGSPLEEAESWDFTTAAPSLTTMDPEPGARGVHLDAGITLTFNQPMDPDSVADNFRLIDAEGDAVPGDLEWNEDNSTLTFRSDNLLKRDMQYTVELSSRALASGGTRLGADFEASLQTVPTLAVLGSEPLPGGTLNVNTGVTIYFNAPIQTRNVIQFLTFTPDVPNLRAFPDENDRTLRLYGDFDPDTSYSLLISPNLPDAWSGRLSQEHTLNFRTLPLDPSFTIPVNSDVIYLTPEDSSLNALVTNLTEIPYTLGRLPMEDLTALLGPNSFEQRQGYRPEERRDLQFNAEVEPNRNETVSIPLNWDGEPLEPGLYFLRFGFDSQQIFAGPYILAVSDINLAFKLSATQALVWAVDLRDGTPLVDASIAVYADDGAQLASGRTDAEGVFQGDLQPREDLFSTYYAVIGQPGEATFALGLSNWSQGVEGWNYGLPIEFNPPRLEAYLYTDRPIYQPGQTVYYRAAARQAYNGRYDLPEQASLPLVLYNDIGEVIDEFDLPLSAFGTAHGEYELAADTKPGIYRLAGATGVFGDVSFQVAEYRVPEIDLQVAFTEEDTLAGEALHATVSARYFFDAPAGDLAVSWSLFRTPTGFDLPGYQVGPEDNSWLSPLPGVNFSLFGEQVDQGEAETDADGQLEMDFSTQAQDVRYSYTLEVTAQDESGLPVSARAETRLNPAEFFIGLHPDSWVGQSGRESQFDVQVVDWAGQPAGEKTLRAEFRKVVWERVEPQEEQPFQFPTFTPMYTTVGTTDFVTAADGRARLAFTPPEPGSFQLQVTGIQDHAGGALSQVTVWVAGAGQAVWPNLPNQHLQLTADAESYQPGDTAQVFVPNPFGEEALALVTVERGVVLRYQTLTLAGNGQELTFPLTEVDAPNVYISVTLLGRRDDGAPDFRQGYVNLAVEPSAQTLQVAMVSEPQRTGPGEQVSFGVRVTDDQGNPATGEFSLSVVDRAVLALADPNAMDIVPAFYANQPLGVRTGLSLAAYAQRRVFFGEGVGGGGGGFEQPLAVREKFLDTAYWNAEIVTDENGEALVTVDLPDNLTTWQVDLRGLTADTLVGQAEAQVVTTKDLLVRPAAPRFLVQGDHAQLAAVVNNNTDAALPVEVSLQASGFELDDPGEALQRVTVPAGGRARVAWWGTALNVPSAELIFAARSGDLQDAVRLAQGALPVMGYTAPQSFATAGVLDEGGELLELVSLPRSFDPAAGSLRVELAPSLAAAMVGTLDSLENYPYACTEQTLSRFLPNLETYRVLQAFDLEAPNLQTRLDRTLGDGLADLVASQNEDGGWGWWPASQSDPYISAYVLFGLARARQAGVAVDEGVIEAATAYLRAGLPALEDLTEGWQFDRLAFEYFALTEAGSGDLAGAMALYEGRDRLNPWAQAYLAMTLDRLAPADDEFAAAVDTVYSDLEAGALRSATGAHWEDREPSWQNMSSPIYASAVVLYALAQHDPASPLVADAARYLAAHRDAQGGWNSTYASAWSIMALAQVMQGTAELGGDFDFSAALNGAPLAAGQAGGETQLTPVTAEAPISSLQPQSPNALRIEREDGPGRLYYRANLQVTRPVEDIAPLDAGVSLARSYYPAGGDCDRGGCPPILGAAAGDLVDVRLTLVVPQSAYYLLVEDYLPAGAEVLDINLKTSQLGAADVDARDPFRDGWGWWYFGEPQIYADHIAWAAEALPPGTYELTYTLSLLQPGEYRVLPARAWQFYFPEVQGNSAGEVFEIGE